MDSKCPTNVHKVADYLNLAMTLVVQSDRETTKYACFLLFFFFVKRLQKWAQDKNENGRAFCFRIYIYILMPLFVFELSSYMNDHESEREKCTYCLCMRQKLSLPVFSHLCRLLYEQVVGK